MVSSKDPNKQKITQLCKNVEFILPKFPRFKTGYRCFRSFCYCRELLRNTGLKGLDWKDWTERTGLKGLDWKDWTERTGLKGLDWKDWTDRTGLKGLDWKDWTERMDWKDWTERTGLKGLDWNFNRRIHSQHDEQSRSNLAQFSKQRNTFKSCSQRINARLVWHSKPRARLDVKIIYISRNW